MTHLKIYFTFVFVLLFAVSCEKENLSPKKGKLEFSFAEIEAASGGRIKGNISSVLVTIKNADGETVHDRENISLYKFGDDFISEPIALSIGSYTLIEFFVLDEDETAIYATPFEGSPLAYLVEDPLPIEFSINKDEVTKVSPQVIKIEGNMAVDFGYSTFGLDIVETFTFSAGVLVYNPVVKNFELTSAHMKITSSGETLYDRDLSNVTSSIRIRDGLETYHLLVTKTGYLSYEETFTIDELKAFVSGTPLVITLLVESVDEGLVAHYPFNGNANDQTANELHGIVNGPVLTTDRDGSPEAAYSFDGFNDYIQVPHDEILNISGDFSISLWANIASNQEPHGGINDILRKWNGDAQGYPFSISYLNELADDVTEDKILYARYDGQICENSAVTHSPLITNDTFVHIVLIKKENKIRTYLNNVFTAEIADPTSCSVGNDADMTIGCRGNLVRFFKGKIDDIRIYGRALSEDEVGNLNGE